MCNEFQLRLDFGSTEWWKALGHDIDLHWDGLPSNRPLNDPFKPSNRAPMLRAIDPANPRAGLTGYNARWWLIPFFHKGAVRDWKSMCTNARVEAVESTPAFREPYKRRRALIPLTSFIEYDTPPGWKKGDLKRRWEVSWEPKDECDRVRFFAGIWDRSNPSDMPEPLDSFAFITGPAGPDMQRIHTRQPAVLTLDQGLAWLALDGPGKAALPWTATPSHDDPQTAPWAATTPPGTFTLTERPRELDMAPRG